MYNERTDFGRITAVQVRSYAFEPARSDRTTELIILLAIATAAVRKDYKISDSDSDS